MKSLYNFAKASWTMKFDTTTLLPHHMRSILGVSWETIKVSMRKITSDIFVKKNVIPLRPTKLTTNNQACVASVKHSSGSKAEVINRIARRTVVSINL